MNVLIIVNGVVVNVITADSVERAQSFYPDAVCIEYTGQAWIGWTYSDGVFTPPVDDSEGS